MQSWLGEARLGWEGLFICVHLCKQYFYQGAKKLGVMFTWRGAEHDYLGGERIFHKPFCKC